MFEEATEEFIAPSITEFEPTTGNNQCSCGRGNNNTCTSGGAGPQS